MFKIEFQEDLKLTENCMKKGDLSKFLRYLARQVDKGDTFGALVMFNCMGCADGEYEIKAFYRTGNKTGTGFLDEIELIHPKGLLKRGNIFL